MTGGIILYGRANSRASRCLWVLEELALPYDHVATDPARGDTREATYRDLNPAGKIPTLRDGTLVLHESLAICLYLAMRYGRSALWPEDAATQAQVLEGVLFAASEIEPAAAALLDESLLRPATVEPDARRVERATLRTHQSLSTLERLLSEQAWYAAGTFTVADIALASVVKWLKGANLDLSGYVAVRDWLARAMGRPAYQRVLARKQPLSRR